MDDNEKKYNDDLKEYWEGFPEAPCTDTFKWLDAEGYDHLTTLRAYSPHLLFKQMEKTISGIRDIGGKPVGQGMPIPAVQEIDASGLPVVDGDGNPVMKEMPADTHLFTVKALFHDVTKSNKDVLKVVTVEEPYNTKYGVSCFHPAIEGWKVWAIGPDNKHEPPAGYGHVVIQDAGGERKYADVIEFR